MLLTSRGAERSDELMSELSTSSSVRAARSTSPSHLTCCGHPAAPGPFRGQVTLILEDRLLAAVSIGRANAWFLSRKKASVRCQHPSATRVLIFEED
jgi:hypothetical protein